MFCRCFKGRCFKGTEPLNAYHFMDFPQKMKFFSENEYSVLLEKNSTDPKHVMPVGSIKNTAFKIKLSLRSHARSNFGRAKSTSLKKKKKKGILPT